MSSVVGDVTFVGPDAVGNDVSPVVENAPADDWFKTLVTDKIKNVEVNPETNIDLIETKTLLERAKLYAEPFMAYQKIMKDFVTYLPVGQEKLPVEMLEQLSRIYTNFGNTTSLECITNMYADGKIVIYSKDNTESFSSNILAIDKLYYGLGKKGIGSSNNTTINLFKFFTTYKYVLCVGFVLNNPMISSTTGGYLPVFLTPDGKFTDGVSSLQSIVPKKEIQSLEYGENNESKNFIIFEYSTTGRSPFNDTRRSKMASKTAKRYLKNAGRFAANKTRSGFSKLSGVRRGFMSMGNNSMQMGGSRKKRS